jgi:hypothetical protein
MDIAVSEIDAGALEGAARERRAPNFRVQDFVNHGQMRLPRNRPIYSIFFTLPPAALNS